LDEMPWKAQQDMIEELKERGRDIVAQYLPEELVQYHPVQLVCARVKK
jgi:hypothetical protein